MLPEDGLSDVLYYPFSRCINIPTLKQMLLVFESVSFCDPVEDEAWRDHLFTGLEREDARFERYRDVRSSLPILFDAGVLRRIDPSDIGSIHDEITTEAILSDLGDARWHELASSPEAFGLPIQRDRDTRRPSWNVFKPKIPEGFIERLREDKELRRHLLFDGGEDYAWQLTYEAGSSVGINTHLAVAHEAGLQPVTDSAFHHKLMLMKMMRGSSEFATDFSVHRSVSGMLARQAITSIVSKWLSKDALERLSIEDILEFRQRSMKLRRTFFDDVRGEIEKRLAEVKPQTVDSVAVSVSGEMIKKARAYESEMEGLRDQLWPDLVEAFGSKKGIFGVAAASLGASTILSPVQILIASIPAVVEPAKVLLRWNASRRKLARKSTGSIAYLAEIEKSLSRD